MSLTSRYQALEHEQKINLWRIVFALAAFIVFEALPVAAWIASAIQINPSDQLILAVEFILFLIPYLIVGADVVLRAIRGIFRGKLLDENVLMTIATIGAFALVLFPESHPHMAEGAAVMIFYQVGEWFCDYALDQSRNSIKSMMNIAPEHAYVCVGSELKKVSPKEVEVGDTILIKPGDRIPLDGTIVDGYSQIDTSAITGEALPRLVHIGSEVTSGCINLSGSLRVRVEKPYEHSTVQKILDLVENANDKKTQAENFISRFARIYTPVVVACAAALALIPPLCMGESFTPWISRGLIFLVVSCPCALVISVPLSFFGGIGASSREGILIKGSNYLEGLSKVDTVAFDKTGTLTSGSFGIVTVHPSEGNTRARILRICAHAEVLSNHPTAQALRQAYTAGTNPDLVSDFREVAGMGVIARFEEKEVAAGNTSLMQKLGIDVKGCEVMGTCIHVAENGNYLGHIVIADSPKDDASQTIMHLHHIGIERAVMLTGDRSDVANAVSQKLGMDAVFSELMPQDKVHIIEQLIQSEEAGKKLAFVGDGINDAPVLMRADIGIAMGAMGSDAAIEAADIVLMDDKPSAIACAIHIARKTMKIVWQNITFALGVKVVILALAALGIANMWIAVFGDVGVACLAIANAMRCLYTSHLQEHVPGGKRHHD